MFEKSIWQNPSTGFRMMPWDPVAMLLCVGATIWAWEFVGVWSLIAPYVLGTFFLFCNVFRVRTRLELLWSAVFVSNALAWLYFEPNLWGILAVQTPVTALVIIRMVRSDDYHGILADSRI